MTKTNKGGSTSIRPWIDGKAVEAGHLDVEEDEVGLVGLDRADRLAAVGGGGDDLDIVMRLQPQLQALGRQRLVVDEDGADGHDVLVSGFVREFR